MNPELTAREIQIIEYAALGMGIGETAENTGLAFATVRTHRARLTKKLGSKNLGITYAVTLMYKRGVFKPDLAPSPFPLTRRQMQVLLLIATGLENEEIAVRLGVAEDTVKTHVRRMLEKTKTVNRTHLVGEAFRNGTLVLQLKGRRRA
jgi:DNA-binding CsgD family transcriptional regulator